MIIWILEFSWFGYLISVEFLEGDVFDQSFYVACWFQFCAIKLYSYMEDLDLFRYVDKIPKHNMYFQIWYLRNMHCQSQLELNQLQVLM